MSIFARTTTRIMTQPSLEINLNHIINNYKLLSEIVHPATSSAVVKDNAYGLDAAVVAKALYEDADCHNFWVAHAIEAEKIVEHVSGAQIFVLQGMGDDNLNLFQKYKFIPVISSPEMLAYWKKNPLEGVKPVIHVDTGLNRLGFRMADLQRLNKSDLKIFSMVMSHLACADEKGHFMNTYQLEKFNYIRQTYFPGLPSSLSASDGAFLGEDYCFNMVRLGAAMYGINTAPYRQNQMENVVTVKAPILQVADLSKGDFVGYSATYRAATDRKLAILSIGYGDGIPLSLSNVGKVLFKKKDKIQEARIIGRVSMDNIICDITDISGIKSGDCGYLLCAEYTLDDMARDAGTIPYEILSRIGKNTRYSRDYIFK